jgi:hypothetical protein
MLILRIDYGV